MKTVLGSCAPQPHSQQHISYLTQKEDRQIQLCGILNYTNYYLRANDQTKSNHTSNFPPGSLLLPSEVRAVQGHVAPRLLDHVLRLVRHLGGVENRDHDFPGGDWLISQEHLALVKPSVGSVHPLKSELPSLLIQCPSDTRKKVLNSLAWCIVGKQSLPASPLHLHPSKLSL